MAPGDMIEDCEAVGAIWAELIGIDVKEELGQELLEAECLELDWDTLPDFHGFGSEICPSGSEAEEIYGALTDATTINCIEESEIIGTKDSNEDKEEITTPCSIKLDRITIAKKELVCQIEDKHEELRSHIEKGPKGRGNFNCHICGLRISQKDSLVRHLKLHKKQDTFDKQNGRKIKKKYLECDVCGNQVTRRVNMVQHLKIHDKLKTVRCHPKLHKKQDTIKKKMEKKEKKYLECDVCGKQVTRRVNMVQHLKIHEKLKPVHSHLKLHKEQDTFETKMERIEKKYLGCDVCGKQVTRRVSMVQHLKIHEKLKPACGLLDKELFRMPQELTNHMNMHEEARVKVTPGESEEDSVRGSAANSEGNETERNEKERNETEEAVKIDEANSKDVNDVVVDELLESEVNEGMFSRVCEKQFESLVVMTGHKCNRTERVFSCKLCEKTYTKQYNLNRHYLVHTGKKPFTCKVCDESFRLQTELQYHTVVHSDQKLVCKICGKVFNSQRTLKRHELWHAGEKPKKPYMCEVCNKSYRVPSELANHVRTHTGERKLYCDICSQQFLRKQHLLRHLETHTRQKLSCQLCDKRYKTNHGLKKHMKTHTSDKPYQCNVCNKKFLVNEKLEIHMRVHTGEKPFECDFCQKRFTQAAHLRQHRQIHTDEKKYSCNVCNKGFRQKRNWVQHSRVHSKEKPHRCDECGKYFKCASFLANHEKLHTPEKSFSCGVCGKAFSWKTHLTKHLWSHSKKESFSNEMCLTNYRTLDSAREL